MMSTNAQDQGREQIEAEAEAEAKERGASQDSGQGSSVAGTAPPAERAFRGMKIRSGVRAGLLTLPA